MKRTKRRLLQDVMYFFKYCERIEIKNAPEFEPPEKLADVRVLWLDGEKFWCLDFTLELVSRNYN